jgi:siroheme synthase
VFLMGVERLPTIVQQLIAHGRPARTPVAIIERGTFEEQRVTTGTLRTILARARNVKPPATIVVGDVVAVRDAILALQAGRPAWEATAPLAPAEAAPVRVVAGGRRGA